MSDGRFVTIPVIGLNSRSRHPFCVNWRMVRSFWNSEYQTVGRLQNSPYFCVFKYARRVKQKVCNEAENRERDWGKTLKFFFLSPRTSYGRVRLASFARVRLIRHALPISLLILRKKMTVLQSRLSETVPCTKKKRLR